jgi:hypothetical protein
MGGGLEMMLYCGGGRSFLSRNQDQKQKHMEGKKEDTRSNEQRRFFRFNALLSFPLMNKTNKHKQSLNTEIVLPLLSREEFPADVGFICLKNYYLNFTTFIP